MKPVAILYSTVDGQTKKISEFLADHLKQKDLSIQIYPLEKFNKRITEFETLILGASIRYGKHNELVGKFIHENLKELEQINGVFFSVNLVARKEDKNSPDTNPYLIKFMETIPWKPDLTGVFAGGLDYKKYGFFDKLMIKAIMKFTHGPTKTPEPIEYTDWQRVQNFANRIYSLHVNTNAELLKKTEVN